MSSRYGHAKFQHIQTSRVFQQTFYPKECMLCPNQIYNKKISHEIKGDASLILHKILLFPQNCTARSAKVRQKTVYQ